MANAGGTPRLRVTRAVARTALVQEIVPNSGWTEDSTGHYLLVDLPEFKKEDVKLQVDSSGRIVVKGERQAGEQKRVRFHLSFPAPTDAEVDKIAGKFDGGILYVTLPKQIVQENKESDTEKAEIGSIERAEEHDSHTTNEHDKGQDFNQQVGHTPEEHDSHMTNAHDERRDFNQQVGHTHEEHDSHMTNAHDEGRDFNQQLNTHEEHEEERHENVHMGDFSGQVIRKWDQETMLRSAVDVLKKNKEIVVTAVIAFSLGLYVSSKLQYSEAP